MNTFYEIEIKREKDEALIQSLFEYDQLKLNKAEFIPAEPFEMKISEGSKLYDVVGFQDTSNFAISETLYNLLLEHKITGWKAYEISIKGVDKKFYGLQIIGKCGKLKEPKTEGFYIGFDFDYDSWDKSDIFSPEETVLLFCTKKVRTLLMKNKISNVELTDISKVQAYSTGIE